MPDPVASMGKGQLSAALSSGKANVHPEEEPFQKHLAEDHNRVSLTRRSPAVKGMDQNDIHRSLTFFAKNRKCTSTMVRPCQ
jgi:hypothetical protein